MMIEYSKYKNNISNYSHDSSQMNDQYLNLFKLLINKKDIIIKKRNLFRSPILLIKNLIFIIMRLINVVKFFKRCFFRKFI